MKGATFLAIFLLLAMVGLGGAMTCTEVETAMAPCVNYLTSGGNPPTECCDGCKRILAGVTTAAERQAACECLKKAAQAIPTLKDDAAKSLPEKCGVPLNIPISKTTDCSKIGFEEEEEELIKMV